MPEPRDVIVGGEPPTYEHASRKGRYSQTSFAMDWGDDSDESWRENRSSIGSKRAEEDEPLKPGLNFYPSFSAGGVNEDFDQDNNDANIGYQQPDALNLAAAFSNAADCHNNQLAPEHDIIVFALRMAIIEKSGSGIGALSFIWASTIILGGFAGDINTIDFVVVAVILVTEGTRIFSRSRELEWQHLVAPKPVNRSAAYQTARRAVAGDKNHPDEFHVQRQESLSGRGMRQVAQPPELVVLNVCTPTPAGLPPESFDDRFNSQEQMSTPSMRRASERQTVLHLPENQQQNSPNVENPPTPKISISSRGTERNTKDDVISGKRKIVRCLRSLLWKKFSSNFSSRLTSVLTNFAKCLIPNRGVSVILYWIQLASAIICLVLSGWRLFLQKFHLGDVGKKGLPVNLFLSLNIFYSLALAEALLFLVERVYWAYKINYEQLMAKANNKADLGDDNEEMMRHFFFEVFKKRIEGSVFGGMDMDLIDYSLTLLQSDNSYQQLGGSRMLRKIAQRDDILSADALRRLGTAPGMIERLVNMLSWRGPHEDEIRKEVAALICPLVRQSKNSFRITSVPGSMEGIVSLLKSQERDDFGPQDQPVDPITQHTIPLRLDGLRILVALAREQVNLLPIGETRGLVPILVSFIAIKDVDHFQRMEGDQLKIFEKALRLLTMLSAARNNTGNILRTAIARVVCVITSMRNILDFGEPHPQFQWMAIEILTNLALDDDIRRSIGSTGGVIRKLFMRYTRDEDGTAIPHPTIEGAESIARRAGDALNLLSIRNQRNCFRMMDLQDRQGTRPFISALIELLNEHREQTISSAKILRSLMEYANNSQKREIAICSSRVMTLVMTSSSQKIQEAVIGLAPRVITVLDDSTYDQIFENIDRNLLIQKLLKNLEQVSIKFPRIRRHSIEFIIALVKRDVLFLKVFMQDGILEGKLVQTLDTISEIENFVIFAGAEGLTRHSITMEDLLQKSLSDLRTLMTLQSQSSTGRGPFPSRLSTISFSSVAPLS